MRLEFLENKEKATMEEIEKRLRESTDACIKGFEAWVKANKSLESRESLMEAMHDVRKVVARLEIEIAISERERLGSRPIPIPPHRSQRKRGGEGVEEGADFGNEEFEEESSQAQAGGGGGGEQRRHQGGGRNRRPMHRGGGNNGNGNNNGNSNSDNA
jgi:hypothetical protein